ncbi:MAG: hypothetical protein AABY15_02390 [Nanoarchaeota archaeon]
MGLSDRGVDYEKADTTTKRIEYQSGDMVMAKLKVPVEGTTNYIGRLAINDNHIPRRLSLSPYTGLYHGDTTQEAVKRVLEAEKMTIAQLAKNDAKPLSKQILAWMRVELDEEKFTLEKLL